MLIISLMSLYQSTGFINIILKFIKFPFIWCPICTEWVPTKLRQMISLYQTFQHSNKIVQGHRYAKVVVSVTVACTEHLN